MASIVGLTGGIASGKSTVSNMLKKRGFTIIDADIASRVVVEPGEKAYDKIIHAFGEDILLDDKTIDRKRLGSIIFHNNEKRSILNSIVHPEVRKRMDEWKERALAEGKNTIFYDIPLLFESNLTHLVDKIIVVYVDEDVQLKRLKERNHLTDREAKARIHSQLSLHEKKQLANAVINNNGSLEETEQQIDAIIEKWKLQV